MRQSREVLWVVFSSLFFIEISKNGRRGHGSMFASAKGKQQKWVRQLQCLEQVYWSYPILPFRIVACTVFATTFLETAVYSCMKWVHCTFENFIITTGKKEPPHGYPRTTLKSHINFSYTSSVFQQKAPLHLRGLLHVAVSKKAWATTTMMTETTKWKAMGLIGKT